MNASILRGDVSSRQVRSSRSLFRKLTHLTNGATSTFASTAFASAATAPSACTASESESSESNQCSLPCSSTLGLLAIYGLPFPVMILP